MSKKGFCPPLYKVREIGYKYKACVRETRTTPLPRPFAPAHGGLLNAERKHRRGYGSNLPTDE